MIKGIIFDLDGTLLNTLEDLTDSVNETLRTFNFPERSIMEVNSFIGNGIENLFKRALPEKIPENFSYEEGLKLLKENYKKNSENKTRLFDGIEELISELKKRNIKLGIFSNKPDREVKTLAKKFFPVFNEKFCLGDEDGKHLKPNPLNLFKIIKEMNLSEEEILYVGDSEVDIETGKNANLKTISVTWGFKEKDFLIKKGGSFFIDSPMELLRYT